MKKLIIALLFLFTVIIIILTYDDAEASYFSSLGLSTSYIKENNPNYKTNREYKPTITFSHIVDIKSLTVGYSTNRIDNWLNGHKKYDITYNNGAKGINSQKITYDSFLIGKQFKTFLPMLFIANTKIDNKFYLNNNYIQRDQKYAWLYGVNINYFLDKELSLSFSYILPNNELSLKELIAFGININF